MNPDDYGIVEMILSFGLVLGFGFWQLRSLAKLKREARDKANAPKPPDA